MDNFDDWKDAPILRVLPGDRPYPQTTTTTQRFGDRLALLHYPALNDCVDIHTRAIVSAVPSDGNLYVRSGYQSSLMISAFHADTNDICRVWVPQAGDRDDEPILSIPSGAVNEPSISVVTGRHPFPGDSFNLFGSRSLPRELPSIGVLHRCDACGGTSGGPAISLEPEPESGEGRHGTVVAVHSGYYGTLDNRPPFFDGYFATRMSVITQCVDMAAIGEIDSLDSQGRGARVVYADGAERYAICQPQLPDSSEVPFLDCKDESNTDQPRCSLYRP